MGFNYQQPGKVRKVDLVLLVAVIAVIAGLVFWAAR
jgi:hypothetical protein